MVEMIDTDKLSNDDPSIIRFNNDIGSEDSPVAIYFESGNHLKLLFALDKQQRLEGRQ